MAASSNDSCSRSRRTEEITTGFDPPRLARHSWIEWTSAGCAPSSSQISTPKSAIALIAGANCTGCRTPRPQCAASPASPARRSPVTVLKNGIVSDCGARSASAFSSASDSRLHHRVMERVIDAHHAGEDALRLEFGEHRFDRMTWTGQGERTRAVECRDRDRAVMFGDQGLRFFFTKARPRASCLRRARNLP